MLFKDTTILLKYLKGQPYSSVCLIGEGWSSVAFQADDFIIRFPKHDLQDYIKEKEICDFLRDKTNVLLPRTELCRGEIPYVRHKKIGGYDWNLMTIDKLSAKELTLLAKDIALFFHEIHQQKTKYIAPTFVPVTPDDINNAFMNGLDGHLLQELLDIYKNTTLNPVQSSSLIHGDFSYENSTLDKNNRLYGVFDWCNSGMGDYIFDFVTLHTFFPQHFVENVISQYQEMSDKDFDFKRFKKMYLLRNIYLLYWKHKKSALEPTVLSDKVTEILNKAAR